MRLELEIGREDPKQLQAIMYHIGLEVDSSQATILQPVSENGVGTKVKNKTEICHSSKEQLSSITVLKIIAKQGVDEKVQLEEQKAEVMTTLASKIHQL